MTRNDRCWLLAALLVLHAGALWSQGPAISDIAPKLGLAGDTFMIFGSNFGPHPQDHALFFSDGVSGFTATVISIESAGLVAQLNPIGTVTTGELHLAVGERLALPDAALLRGNRLYGLTNISWFEGMPTTDAAFSALALSPGTVASKQSDPATGALRRRPGGGRKGLPFTPHNLVISLNPVATGGLVRLLDNPILVEAAIETLCPPPRPRSVMGGLQLLQERRMLVAQLRLLLLTADPEMVTSSVLAADLAAALNQEFAPFGLIATAEGEVLVIGTTDDCALADGVAVISLSAGT